MADDLHYGDITVLAWQDWKAQLARLRTQYASESFDGDGPSPIFPPDYPSDWRPGRVGARRWNRRAHLWAQGAFDDNASAPSTNVQDESMADLRVIAWQDSRAPLARLLRQFSLGAFDDSAGGGPPPPEPETAQWQPPRLRARSWVRSRLLERSAPWDGDGPAPGVSLDGPGADLRVIAWQDWKAPFARGGRIFTDAPQDLDGIVVQPPTPDETLLVIPWFSGRVPIEQAHNLVHSAALQPDPPPEPEASQSFIAGLGFSTRGYRESKFNPRARVMAVWGNSTQDTSFVFGGQNQTQIFHHHHSQG